MYHSNTIIQIYSEHMKYQKDMQFFETVQNLAVQDFVLKNISCHDFLLRAPLKLLCVNLLS